jgi:POT family proton-dependent oligopeptide transporter
MSVGCLVAGAAMMVMVAAAALYGATQRPVGPGWVIGYFVLLTVGELMVIPVGLALVSELAPASAAAMAMGGWYIAKFLGSLLSGVMGSLWGVIPATVFFAIGAGSVFLAAAALYGLGRIRPVLVRA